MKTQIFARDANPAVDAPLFYAKREALDFMLLTGAVGMIGRHQAQFLCEHRDPTPRPRANALQRDWSGVETGTHWRIVHQTVPGYGPGQPEYQLVK